ncbi:MAG: 3-hydroxyacyl-CoA dehydrogenase family protein [Granulosicoccaceae bacterium]
MQSINKVAVVGAGTMGAGIAGVCAAAGCDVTLLDMNHDIAAGAIERLQAGKRPAITAEQAARISAESIDNLEQAVADADWICEVIIEMLQPKRDLFTRVEAARKDGSLVTSNTSGIPLRDISAGMPERLCQDIAVTHFFNPVHIMRLLELVPGENTRPEVIEQLADFCGNKLGKGVVYAKDTVNFIGNRIGCFWMLAGLHIGTDLRAEGLSPELADAVMSKPMGLPPTGLYGLIDLIGLDIMDSVAKNLESNLPTGDVGQAFSKLPAVEQKLFEAGQLGRKTGGGFYRVTKKDDGSKNRETYDLDTGQWRPSTTVELSGDEQEFTTAMFTESLAGKFAWELMGGTLAYAADLVPDIADDIVNVDRAMRWGFNWAQGPFEMLDAIGPQKFADKCKAQDRPVPKMLQQLLDSGAETFYRCDGKEFFAVDGSYQAVPAE